MIITCGFVRDGKVVPNIDLPEGALVRIEVLRGPIDVPPDLQEELDAWQRASAQALINFERQLDEEERDEPR